MAICGVVFMRIVFLAPGDPFPVERDRPSLALEIRRS